MSCVRLASGPSKLPPGAPPGVMPGAAPPPLTPFVLRAALHRELAVIMQQAGEPVSMQQAGQHGGPTVTDEDLALLKERLELDAAEIDAREEQGALLRSQLAASQQEARPPCALCSALGIRNHLKRRRAHFSARSPDLGAAGAARLCERRPRAAGERAGAGPPDRCGRQPPLMAGRLRGCVRASH